MASARGKARQRRGEFIKQQRRLGKRTDVPTPRRFSGKIWKQKGDPDYNQRLDVVLGNKIREEGKKFSRTVGDLTGDVVINPAKKGLDYLKSGFEGLKLPTIMGMEVAARALEEDKAASRDYEIPWWKGGNPTAVDRGSAADIYLTGAAPGLTPLIQDQDRGAYNEALEKDRLFTTNLNEMTGDNYEAKAGYLALLNDPSRLEDMDPVRGLNYMRSITGDPSNMGFHEFEAMRQSQPEVYGGLTATEIAQKLLPQYREAAANMYGQGFIGDTAAANYGDSIEVPPFIKQATGTASINPAGLTHEQLLALNKDSYYDRVRETVSPFPDDDYLIGDNVLFDQFADEPQNILTSEDLVASEPYTWSALDMYPNLNIPFVKNKYFPNTAIEDITRDDIRGLNQFDLFDLGYAG